MESDCRRFGRSLKAVALALVLTTGWAVAAPTEAIQGQIARLADPAAIESVRTDLTTNYHPSDVIPVLVTAIAADPSLQQNAAARQAAYEILVSLQNSDGRCADPAQIDQLVLGLKDSDPVVADIALKGLAKADPAVAERAVGPLAVLLGTADKAAAAATALGHCNQADEALPKLEDLLRNDGAQLAARTAAAEALSRLRKSPDSLQPLLDRLDNAGKDAAAAGISAAMVAGVGLEVRPDRLAWITFLTARFDDAGDDSIRPAILKGATAMAKPNNLTPEECKVLRDLQEHAGKRSGDELKDPLKALDEAVAQACP